MESGYMANSQRVRHSIRICIDRLIDGVVKRSAKKELSRLGFDADESTTIVFLKSRAIFFLV